MDWQVVPDAVMLKALRKDYVELEKQYDLKCKQANELAEALHDIVYSEPKENSTTYPHAESVLRKYRGE